MKGTSFRLPGVALATVSLAVLGLAAAAQDKEALLKLGKEVYAENCALCHMEDGNAPLEEMNMANGRWKHGTRPEALQKVIRNGVEGTAMMSFKEILTEEQIVAVSHYVLTLDPRLKKK